jgi:hypothetical protein
MKRSVNLNGFQAKHRRISGNDLVDTMRKLGMSDDEIRAALTEPLDRAGAAAANEPWSSGSPAPAAPSPVTSSQLSP